jgi:hypothetical protein
MMILSLPMRYFSINNNDNYRKDQIDKLLKQNNNNEQ